jgi:hypothetical protein
MSDNKGASQAAEASGSILMAGWAAANQGINEARRIKAQNKARIAQMRSQFEFNTQNLHNNNVSIKQNKMKNDQRIQESKLEAQDAFAQTFIGSGVSGRTKDIMEATLQGSVDKAHNESSQIATQESDRQFLGLMRSSTQMKEQLNNMESFDFDAMKSNMNMAVLKAGIEGAKKAASGGAG